jgi:hypothetical protein
LYKAGITQSRQGGNFMKSKVWILRNFIGGLAVFVVLLFSVQFAFSQCEVYFKSGYRKLVTPGFLDSNTEFKLEDWNADGKLDFWRFELNTNNSTENVVVYLNNGSGDWNWNSPVVYTTTIPEFTGSQTNEFYLKDFDSDGDKDIFSAPSWGFATTLYKNNGSGAYVASATQQFQDATTMKTIDFTDLNNDNLLDWIVFSTQSGIGHSVGYRLANANGTFGDLVTIVVSGSAQNSTDHLMADFTGDGKPDIFYSNQFQYRLLTNTGGGNFTVGNNIPTGERTYFVQAKDLNNDGRADIVVHVPYNSAPPPPGGKMYIYYGQTDGTFSATQYPIYNPTSYLSFVIGEFNGDTKPDIFEMGMTEQGSGIRYYSVHTNNGAGSFTRTDYVKDIGEVQYFNFADLNGDNKTDIHIKSRDSQQLKNMFGDQIVNIRYNQCQPAGAVKNANFDGNDRDDLTVWNSTNGNWRSTNAHWWAGRDQSVKQFNWGLGSLGDIPAPGDYDGDGKSDYAVYRNGEGNWYINQSSNGAWLTVRFGLPGDIPVPNNYDGGEKTDIAVYRPSEGNWYILSSETQQFQALHFGANGDKPVPADYDGDNKTDVAIYRPSEGNWYYLKSSDQNYVVFHYGIDTDKPVPADFDGDGKADIAVWRPSNGVWYIFRSSNNSSYSFAWGTTGDIPVPIYENRESAELVVYRPSNALWYNYGKYSSFFYVISNGGNQFAPVYYGLPNN